MEDGIVNGDINATNGGKMTIQGGTINGNVIANNYGSNSYSKLPGSIKIENGTINGNIQAKDVGKVEITGGTISGDVSVSDTATVSVESASVSGAVKNDGTDVVIVKNSTVGSVAENSNVVVVNSTVGSDENVTTAPVGIAAIADGIVYETLQAAVNKGGEILLLNDLEEDIVVAAETNVTIDLNGRKITNKSSHTITNNGTLTVKDSSEEKAGTVDNITHAKATIYNNVGGTVILDGGTFVRSMENGINDSNNGGNSYYAILNHGTMTINDGVTVKQNGKYSSLLENGWQNGKQNTTKTPSVLTIHGGLFDGGLNTIKNDDYGEMVINGGVFKNVAQAAVLNWNVATIAGGEFVSEKNVILNGYANDEMNKGDLTVTGGSFICGENSEIIAQMGGSYSIGSVAVSGGEFSKKVKEDYIVQGKTSVSLAKPSDTKYYIGTKEEMEELLKDKAESGDAITILGGDADLSGLPDKVVVTNSGDGNVTVDGTAVEKGNEVTVHVHKATAVPAKAATTKAAGNIAYWYCKECGKYFKDKTLTQEISKADTVIPKLKETVTKADITAGTKNLNKKIKAVWSKSSLNVTWGKVSKADGYEVYAAKCGDKYKKVKTVKGNKTFKYTVKKINGKKLNTKITYKVKVKAYRIIDKKKVYVGTSYSMHTAGKANKTYTNPKTAKASKKSIALKKGKTKKISVKITKQNSKKKLLKSSHTAKLRYFSTNTGVAAVTKGGTVKAKGKGTCTVYAVTANGVKTTVKVTVK